MAEPFSEKSREEEFYYLLTEGSEHLQGGRIEEARVHFERALQLHPRNEQALNLLGLSLFRLGQLERARQVFLELVQGNPGEPSLRLNLAMVYLKQGRLDDAHGELSRVLDLNPDHPRAASYMGLVLEKKGLLDQAADFYERSGNKKRADEIRSFDPTKTGTFPIPNLAAMGVQATPPTVPGPAAMRAASTATASTPSTTPRPSYTSTAPAPTAESPSTKPPTMTLAAVQISAQGQVIAAKASTTPPTPATAVSSGRASTAPGPASMPPGPSSVSLAPTSSQPTAARGVGRTDHDARRESVARTLLTPTTTTTAATTTRAPAPTPTPPPPTKSAATATTTTPPSFAPSPTTAASLAPAPATTTLLPSGVTEVSLAGLTIRATEGRSTSRDTAGRLVLPIVDQGYVRSDLLVGVSGGFEFEAVHRRYRGRKTDSLFGGVDAALVGLAGQGFAVLSLGERVATMLTFTQDEAYLVEHAVVGFGTGLVWENGRLPSEVDGDLDIVHLRGTGCVTLGTERPIASLLVTSDAPCFVHASRLLGWSGQLLPFRAPLAGLPDAARRVPVVRFEGSGVVLTV